MPPDLEANWLKTVNSTSVIHILIEIMFEKRNLRFTILSIGKNLSYLLK